MTLETNRTLEEKLAALRVRMEEATNLGLDGDQMAQRIEGDLSRLISSGYMNLSDYIYSAKKGSVV